MRNLSGYVADRIGTSIVSGGRLPGSLLSSDIEGSEEFGVSRAAYREAIKILGAKGLVESRQKAGTHVSKRQHWNLLDPDVLAWMFESEPSETFVRDLFELRSVIEPSAAALAARRRTAQQLSQMGHAIEEMASRGLYTPEGRQADEEFHAQILKATGNEMFISLINSISAAIHWSVVFNTRRNRKIRDSIPDHRELYAAIADGDPERARQTAHGLVVRALEDTNISIGLRT